MWRIPTNATFWSSIGRHCAQARESALWSISTSTSSDLLFDRVRKSRELGAETGASDVAIAARVLRLVADRALVPIAVFDWEKAGFEWLAIAKIRVDNARFEKLHTSHRAGNCTAVAIVFGDADILASFLV